MEPGVHRPGILGATSKRPCLRRRAAWSPAVEPYALSSSLPQQTLDVCVSFCYLRHTLFRASLHYREQQNMHLIHFIRFINMLSWCLRQHRATEPSALESLHNTFWKSAQSQHSFDRRQQVRREILEILIQIPSWAMVFNELDNCC